jgi:hypothetical protein
LNEVGLGRLRRLEECWCAEDVERGEERERELFLILGTL